MNWEVRMFPFKACLNKESGLKELSSKMDLIAASNGILSLTRKPLQKRENWKEKCQIKHIKDLYMISPGIASSFHSPTTSTCTKFISESRECWLENVDHVPSLIPFLKQNPPVDVKVFHLVLAWDEKDKFTRFYGFLFLFQVGICNSG